MVKIRRDAEIVRIAAASRALELKAKHSGYEYEEILKEVMVSLEYDEPRGNTNSNISAVAAVDKILKLKKEYPKYTNKQLIQKMIEDSKKSFVNEEENE